MTVWLRLFTCSQCRHPTCFSGTIRLRHFSSGPSSSEGTKSTHQTASAKRPEFSKTFRPKRTWGLTLRQRDWIRKLWGYSKLVIGVSMLFLPIYVVVRWRTIRYFGPDHPRNLWEWERRKKEGTLQEDWLKLGERTPEEVAKVKRIMPSLEDLKNPMRIFFEDSGLTADEQEEAKQKRLEHFRKIRLAETSGDEDIDDAPPTKSQEEKT